MKINLRTPIALAAVLLFCASYTAAADDEKYADKAVSLGYVANAVQALVAFGAPVAELTGEALVQAATKRNPKLLKPLADLFVTARHDGKFSSVLMCDAKRTYAIAEDAGCTSSRIVLSHSLDDNKARCEFSLILDNICPVN